MKVFCAWCKCLLKPDDGSGLPDSHGICLSCKDIIYPRKDTDVVGATYQDALRAKANILNQQTII